jgi:hypothetical protein
MGYFRENTWSAGIITFYFVRCLADNHLLTPDASCFPLRLRDDFFADTHQEDIPATANLSEKARAYLATVGIEDPEANEHIASLVWMHVLAVGYSPQYLAENRDGVRDDWPRVPLPNTHEALLASAELGGQIAALLDSDNKTPGIDTGTLRVELKVVALPSRVGGGS